MSFYRGYFFSFFLSNLNLSTSTHRNQISVNDFIVIVFFIIISN
jgi:hypothetical protein